MTTRGTLYISLFGELGLRYADAHLPFDALPKCTPLLAYLLLNRQRANLRDSVAFALWPDVAEQRARANLRRHLYDLRRVLPEGDWIISQRGRIQWNPLANYWLDVAAFAQLLQGGHTTDAVALQTAPLLPMSDDAWLLFERERLHNQLLVALQKLARGAADEDMRLRYAEQLLQHDPLREEGVQLALLAEAISGNVAAAVQRYEQFERELSAEIATEPHPRTQQLIAAIRQHAPSDQLRAILQLSSPTQTAKPDNRHNLPTLPRTVLGRTAAQQQICALLTTSPTRLLTLTGPSGIGKTTLALTVARTLHATDHFPDGIYFVPLADCATEQQVLAAIGKALQLRVASQNDLFSELLDLLRYRETLLLLDNCEHLPAVPALIAQLLMRAARLRLLVTSQVTLNLAAEHVLPLDPLDPAVAQELFISRAQSADVRFKPTPTTSPLIAQLCQQLDYLPLAIELAAARVRHLPLPVIVSQWQDNLDLLATTAHDVSARHRTLTAAIQWSYNLLAADEKQLFAALSIFVGGFTPAAVGAVIFGRKSPNPAALPIDILDKLTGLADRHLIMRDQATDEPRFWMLHTLRQFARRQLATTDALRTQHLDYFAQLAQTAKQVLEDTAPPEWLQRLLREEQNWQAALQWGATHSAEKAATIVIGLYTYWRWYARIADGIYWCETLLQQRDQLQTTTQIELLQDAGIWVQRGGDFARAYHYFEEALQLARQHKDSDLLASTLNYFGIVASRGGDPVRARELVRESIALERARHDELTPTLAAATLNLASLLLRTGEREAIARLPIDDCEQFLRDYGSDMTLYLLTLAAIRPNSAEYIREGFALARRTDNQYAQLVYLPTIAEQQDSAVGARLMSAFRQLSQTMRVGWPPSYAQRFESAMAVQQAELGVEQYARRAAEGATWSLAEAVAYAETLLD